MDKMMRVRVWAESSPDTSLAFDSRQTFVSGLLSGISSHLNGISGLLSGISSHLNRISSLLNRISGLLVARGRTFARAHVLIAKGKKTWDT